MLGARNKSAPLEVSPAAVSALPLAEQAYQRLLASIQDRSIPPGTRLTEVDLAQRLGISRTPVREALRRLQADGLAGATEGAGLTVMKLDAAAIKELYAMRELLESNAARLCAREASAMDIIVLRECADRDLSLLDSPARLADNNRAFHQILYRSAQNRYLLASLNALQTSLTLLGPTTLANKERALKACNEHQAIVTAIENRDADTAEKITRAHIRAAFAARLAQSQ
jgi:DNA-binding GntR family transcriptional regulator